MTLLLARSLARRVIALDPSSQLPASTTTHIGSIELLFSSQTLLLLDFLSPPDGWARREEEKKIFFFSSD